MNEVDRPFIPGRFEIEDSKTGELWERRGGSWSKIRDARPSEPEPPEAA